MQHHPFLSSPSSLRSVCMFSVLRFLETGSHSSVVGGTVTSFSLDFQFVKFSLLLVELFSLPVQPRWLSQLVLTAQLPSCFLQTNGCCCCRKCNHPSLCQRLFPWEDPPDTQRLFPPLSDSVYTLKRSVRHGRHPSCFQQKKLLLTHVALNWNMSHPGRNAGLLKISYQ